MAHLPNSNRYTRDHARRSGRSTMAALNYVHLILDNPGEWVEIVDHGPTLECDRQLFVSVCRVLDALGVPYQANKGNHKILCSGPPQPYEYPDALDIDKAEHITNARKTKFFFP